MAIKGPKKISELPTANSFAGTDRLVILTDPESNAALKTVDVTTFIGDCDPSSNGYTYIPTGVIIQWGTVAANSSSGTATFAVTFPTQCKSVTLSVVGVDAYAHLASAANTSTARIRTNITATANVNYLAIGF